jgi:hypothetical protein
MYKANRIKLKQLLKITNSRIVYVLPSVITDKNKCNFILGTYFCGEFYIIDKGLKKLGNSTKFRAGMKLKLTLVNDEINTEILDEVTSPKHWIKGGSYKKTTVCHGQSILITAAPSQGKTGNLKALLDSYESNGATMFKVLFGERRDDDLGSNTIDCDSSATLEYQLDVLYQTLTEAIKSAYSGKQVCFGMDSLTRIVESMTDKYSDTHMLSGGISFAVKNMVSRLFRMGGQLGKGRLTIIGTCLYSSSSSTWKNIYTELKSVSNAEFLPGFDGRKDYSRKKLTKFNPTVKVFGLEIAY